MSDPETERGTWLATGPAAARLGITPDGLRKAIRRGKCPYSARRDNRGTWLVCIPDRLATVPPDSPETVPDTRDAELAALRATVDGLHGQVQSLQALAEAQRAHIADVRGELAAERARVDQLLERLAERPARRWWWRGG